MKKGLCILLLFYISFPLLASDVLWQEMATRDLRNIKAQIEDNHPGSKDSSNPGFKQWLTKGYLLASEELKYATNYSRYYFILKKFINGFHDVHLSLTPYLEQKQLRWPGFVLAYRNHRYVVYSVSGAKKFGQLPKVGDELLRCGEKQAEFFFDNNIEPFFANMSSPSAKVAYAPYIFLDFGNPFALLPNKCTFKQAQSTVDIKLNWHDVLKDTVWGDVQKAGFGSRQEFTKAEFMKDGLWITIPTFKMQGAHVKKLTEIWSDLPQLRQAKYLVIDLRGNTGGSSEWGRQFIYQLFGPAYAAYLEFKLSQKNQTVEYRASKQNFLHFRKTLPQIANQFGENSRIYQHFKQTLSGLKAALHNGEDFYRFKVDLTRAHQDGKPKPASLYKGQMILLTDGQCVSACLSFVDLLMQVDGVLHAGLATGTDTPYTDVIHAKLPSGLFILTYPTKIYRNRLREINKPYIPKYRWSGDIWDTNGIQDWLKKEVLTISN